MIVEHHIQRQILRELVKGERARDGLFMGGFRIAEWCDARFGGDVGAPHANGATDGGAEAKVSAAVS